MDLGPSGRPVALLIMMPGMLAAGNPAKSIFLGELFSANREITLRARRSVPIQRNARRQRASIDAPERATEADVVTYNCACSADPCLTGRKVKPSAPSRR